MTMHLTKTKQGSSPGGTVTVQSEHTGATLTESHRIRAFSNSGVRRGMLTAVGGTYSFTVKV